jgi:hypothetical protein
MPVTEERLSGLRLDYDAVHALRGRREELSTVEQARAAYESVVADETRVLDALRRRKESLEREWGRRIRAPAEPGPEPWLVPWQPTGVPSPSPRPAPLPRPPRPDAGQRLRRRLTLLINQHRYVWPLTPAVLGQVNQIAEDNDRPLGEALALLPWEAFAGQAGESEEAYLERLAEWGKALAAYRHRLEADVEVQQARLGGWLGIWQLWRAQEGPEGQQRWEAFLAGKRRSLEEEAEGLRGEIAGLEARLAGRGGDP